MKSQHLSKYARIALVVSVTGVMTACVSDPHYYDPYPYNSSRVVSYDYWYYPAIGAYYDPHSHIYIYHEHDRWIRARELPRPMRSHLGHYVTVRSPNDRPYEEHHRHREQYQPERYREREHTHHGDDAWIGAPPVRSPQPDRDDRRFDSHDRDRDGKDRRHEPERGAVTVPPFYRGQDVKYPRQIPDTRRNDAPRHREEPADATPIKWRDRVRQLGNQKEKSREPSHSVDTRRNNDRRFDRGGPDPRARQPEQDRAPDSRRQPPKTPPQAAPGHREPPTRTVPAKQNDKGQQREKRKEDSKHRYREGDDRRGNDSNDDATSQKRPPGQFERYEQYR